METSAVVERCLSAFLAGPDSELKSVASQFRALPVYSDMGGTLFITPTLEVLVLDNDGASLPVREASDKWRLVAAVSAAEKYPELEFLVPARPTSAPNCSHCGGSGWLVQWSARCGECYGLGWQALHSNNSLESDA